MRDEDAKFLMFIRKIFVLVDMDVVSKRRPQKWTSGTSLCSSGNL